MHPIRLPIFLRCNHNQRLVLRLPSSSILLLAAPVCFVDFHDSGQAISTRPHHGAPQFMQPCPHGVVTAQAQFSLQPYSADAMLLAGDCPIARNQRASGFRVSWKMVPAVTEL